MTAPSAWLGRAIASAARGARDARRATLGRLTDLEALALPQRCPGCGAQADFARLLCERCWARVPRLDLGLCVRCLTRERDPSACVSHPGFGFRAAWIYDERAARVVRALKVEERRVLAPALGELLAEHLPIDYRPDLVLEVPLHPARLRERGFNQSTLLADAVAERLGAPRLEDGLVRVRPTRPQAGLGARARRRNLAAAFAAPSPRALQGREVLIVDDVVTTGSTLDACLETLAACGARARGAALAWAA